MAWAAAEVPPAAEAVARGPAMLALDLHLLLRPHALKPVGAVWNLLLMQAWAEGSSGHADDCEAAACSDTPGCYRQ